MHGGEAEGGRAWWRATTEVSVCGRATAEEEEVSVEAEVEELGVERHRR
jgi:hypothetical protein